MFLHNNVLSRFKICLLSFVISFISQAPKCFSSMARGYTYWSSFLFLSHLKLKSRKRRKESLNFGHCYFQSPDLQCCICEPSPRTLLPVVGLVSVRNGVITVPRDFGPRQSGRVYSVIACEPLVPGDSNQIYSCFYFIKTLNNQSMVDYFLN